MPDNLLFSLVLILLCGFVGGQISRRIGMPPLLGMMLAGIALGTEVTNLLSVQVLDLAPDLRTIAVTIILMRAGLGLDHDKLIKQGSVAIRLGFLPALTEAIAISWLAIWLLGFDWLTGLLLGCIISAESPAVIVPGMLYLKNWGWGVSKGIADAILTGSALSDVLILLLFSLLLNFLSTTGVVNYQLWLLPIQAIAQIILGVILGYLTAKLTVFCAIKQKWTQNSLQNTLIVATFALLLVVISSSFPYFSGYLAVMAMGFFLIKFSPPLARRLRQNFNNLWVIAEIVLFVLMGASIEIKTLGNVLIPGIVLLVLGLLFGRTLGWYLATLGSDWTWREKLFLLPGNSAKATVQAAIGGIPLSLGIPQGEVILAISALSILLTAPLGAWAIPTFAPKLLTQDQVDPAKTSLNNKTVVMGVIENEIDEKTAIAILNQVGDLARRTNGEAIIIYDHSSPKLDLSPLKLLTSRLLADIPYQLITMEDNLERQTLMMIEEYEVTEIIMAQKKPVVEDRVASSGSIFNLILDNSNIPVVLLAIDEQQNQQ